MKNKGHVTHKALTTVPLVLNKFGELVVFVIEFLFMLLPLHAFF